MKYIISLVSLFLLSCATPKNVIYFPDAERFQKQEISQIYSSKIQQDDLLSIVVSSKSLEAAKPFNILNYSDGKNDPTNPQGYLVSSQGEIVFPILGKIKVKGLTHSELEDLIASRLISEGHLIDPAVGVKLLNYKISVLGEVNRPGIKKVNSDRVSIFEAISLAEDLTIYGKRENISIIREENGTRQIATIDISTKDIFNSPYYYLRPNDVIYVEPNKKKERMSVNNPVLLSTVLSATSLLTNIVNFLTR